MKAYTASRDESSPDQFWLVEHPPVFTLGQAGDEAHLIDQQTEIQLVKVDRGGQITYHGPGQIVVYLLLDLKRHGFFVKALVNAMEQAIIDTLAEYGIAAERKPGAPGIYLSSNQAGYEYLQGAKIAALGLKISKHCSYHGLALNLDMNLEPFHAINPCGYEGMKTIDMATLGVKRSWAEVADTLVLHLKKALKIE
jgi:lipoyl(octanoyl) transferase